MSMTLARSSPSGGSQSTAKSTSDLGFPLPAARDPKAQQAIGRRCAIGALDMVASTALAINGSMRADYHASMPPTEVDRSA
jgi:hypothetical protein